MSDIIDITIQIMPSGEQIPIEAPVLTTCKDITDHLLDENVAPRRDLEGNPLAYDLISKSRNLKILPEQTLDDVGIQEGDILVFVPHLVAGVTETLLKL